MQHEKEHRGKFWCLYHKLMMTSITMLAMMSSLQNWNNFSHRITCHGFQLPNNNNNNNNIHKIAASSKQRRDSHIVWSTSKDEVADSNSNVAFEIRNCEYSELSTVADIIMDSFYETNISWRRLYKLAELNRLQNNFPYTDTDLHAMLVAVTKNDNNDDDDDNTEKVIGFVDIDARPCTTKIVLPRPYLSDLAVDPNYRRRGIAQTLIAECEAFLTTVPRDDLYIRVEESNIPAVTMYTQKFGYDVIKSEKDTTNPKKKDNILLTLYKKLAGNDDDDVDVNKEGEDDDDDDNDTDSKQNQSVETSSVDFSI